MSDVAIRVENLSKKFQIGTANSPGYHRLSEALTGIPRYAWKSLFPPRIASEPTGLAAGSLLQPPTSSLQSANEFWALKDVSFEVKQGEVVGIIGRNGAGKSTLLKILSRITEPTSGRFGIRGRVASLLEVGTGFHPELTGRENIYVSGITLGMTRAEIKKRFDEIVDFSGVEKFLDTAVKHYSSGMYVRLGFAVAANLDPEVLIVDEVLAVGDGEFQKKCVKKMQYIGESGATVIVVSHQTSMIASLCSSAIVLEQGRVSFVGRAVAAVGNFLSVGNRANGARFDTSDLLSKVGDDWAELCYVQLENLKGEVKQIFDMLEPICVRIKYNLLQVPPTSHYPCIHVFDENGQYVFLSAATKQQMGESLFAVGAHELICEIPENFLNYGRFTVGLSVICMLPTPHPAFFERDCLHLQVSENMDLTLDNSRHGYAGPIPGGIRPQLKWQVRHERSQQFSDNSNHLTELR